MSRALIMLACACGGAPLAPAARVTPPIGKPQIHDRVPIDPIAALARSGADISWIVPGPAQLVLGGPTLQAPDGSDGLPVILIEDQGSEVRVGIALDHVRFALWIERARLLGLLARDQRVESRAGGGGELVDLSAPEPIEVVLRSGAQVRRLGRKDGWTQVRYLGAVEVDGWVPDATLVDHVAPGRSPMGRIPTGRQTLMVSPGAVIRAANQWAARELAVMATGYFVDTVREIDDAWVEVAYEDGDVQLHGFVSRRDPPGRLHVPRSAEVVPTITATALIANGTCLYAGDDGEPIGFIVGDVRAEVEPSQRAGWYAVSLDTPWGPIAFAARGPTDSELVACAPVSGP